jgi:cytoskeletal protein RodZ
MDAKVSSANQLVINVLIFDFVFLSKKKKKKRRCEKAKSQAWRLLVFFVGLAGLVVSQDHVLPG